MERELFVLMMSTLRTLPGVRHRPPKNTFSDLDELAVLLWATLHDRPINWATRRCNWTAHDRAAQRRRRGIQLLAPRAATLGLHTIQTKIPQSRCMNLGLSAWSG